VAAQLAFAVVAVSLSLSVVTSRADVAYSAAVVLVVLSGSALADSLVSIAIHSVSKITSAVRSANIVSAGSVSVCNRWAVSSAAGFGRRNTGGTNSTETGVASKVASSG